MAQFGEIQNDVLFGKDGELFLASGGHRTTDYATGKCKIDEAVVDIFKSNIVKRAEHSQTLNIPYLHVIYPDKQSVVSDKFIVSDPVRLGPHYIRGLQDQNIQVLYPLDLLRSIPDRVFLHTDTHMSDAATIAVATRIAELLTGSDMFVHREHLRGMLTVALRHRGDLGSKLDPPVETDEIFAKTSWPKFYFRNSIPGGNNGGVDIYFTPNAVFAKRVLWFGDSFGRETVRFLSYFFAEILFLRTPFYHPDIVEQMRPDRVVSSNVERYLASCTLDERRPLFHMFPFLGGRSCDASPEFAEAFSAIMSFPRPPYTEFVEKTLGSAAKPPKFGVEKVQNAALDESIPPDVIPTPSPALSIAKTMGIVPYVHKHDFIFKFVARKWGEDVKSAFNNYYELGKYSAKITLELIEEVSRVKKTLNHEWKPSRLLDFASGYGNASRHLGNFFPGWAISTCDIHEEAIRFNSEVLCIESHLSAASPESLNVPIQDVIVAMSFFSHMPNATYIRWLEALAARLAPGGVLIFTANGHVTESRGTTGVKARENGFGFEPRSEQIDLDGGQYGITISHPRWVIRALEQIPDLRLARFQEGHWWAIQDTYVCIRNL